MRNSPVPHVGTAILVALASLIAIEANKFLVAKSIDPRLSTILVGASVIFFTLCVEKILQSVFRNVKYVRQLIDPKARCEGMWIITLAEVRKRPYSYAVIEYNPQVEGYIYHGSGFDIKGNLRSHWRSTRVAFNLALDGFEFRAEGKHIEEGEIARNWGEIVFEKEMFGRFFRRRFVRGKGHFVDDGAHLLKANFFLDRLTRNDVKSLIGKNSIVSHRDMAELIKKFHDQGGVCREPQGRPAERTLPNRVTGGI